MIFNYRLKSIYKEAVRIIRDAAGRHDVLKDAPADLLDTSPRFDYMADGNPVSSVLLPSDFERGVESPMADITVIFMSVLILVVSGIIAGIVGLSGGSAFKGFTVTAFIVTAILSSVFGMTAIKAGGLAVLMSPPFALFGFFATFFYSTKAKGDHDMFGLTRDEALYNQITADGASRKYQSYNMDIRRIKLQQCKDAAEDTSPIIELGIATGVFSERHGDYFAPDAGMPMAYSMNDMLTHTVIFGTTGTGKTILLKKIFKQVCEKSDAGILVMDGKGALAGELAGIDPKYIVLNPETHKLALFQGLTAIEVTDALAVAPKNESDWAHDGARILIKNAAVLLEALAKANIEGYKFTPRNLLTMIRDNGQKGEVRTSDGEYRWKAMHEVKSVESSFLIEEALQFFAKSWSGIVLDSEKQFSGIMQQAESWLEPLFTHNSVAAWGEADEGVDITSVCNGARIGIDVPAVVYGEGAAVIIANLANQRLDSAIKKRGNTWESDDNQKFVLKFKDEMQEILKAKTDGQMLSMGRSWGVAMVGATQSVDAMHECLSELSTNAMLGNFNNRIAYRSTELTTNFMSESVGSMKREISSIDNEDGKVVGVSLMSSLSAERRVPQSTNTGRLNGGLAEFTKKLVRKSPARYFLGMEKENANTKPITRTNGASSNMALATHLVCTPEELNIFHNERFVPVMRIIRAGVPRRDMVRVTPPPRKAKEVVAA